MNPITALICVALPLAAAPMEESARTFPGAQLRALEIRTSGGDISVEGNDAQEVQVEVIHAGSKNCDITWEQSGETLILSALSKPQWLWKRGCSAGFKVRSPIGLSLKTRSGSGETEVAAMKGALALDVGSGDIRLKDVSGDLTARLGSGSLEGTLRSQEARVRAGSGNTDLRWIRTPKAGRASVKAGSGNVNLTFPAETKLQTELATGSGDIRNDFDEEAAAPFRVSVKTGSGDVRIKKQSRP